MVIDASAAAAVTADAETRDIAPVEADDEVPVAAPLRSLVDPVPGLPTGPAPRDDDDEARACRIDSLRTGAECLPDELTPPALLREPVLGARAGTEGDGSRVMFRQLLSENESSSSSKSLYARLWLCSRPVIGRCRADRPAALRASDALLLRAFADGDPFSEDDSPSLSCFRRGTSLNALFGMGVGLAVKSSATGENGLELSAGLPRGVTGSKASDPLKLGCLSNDRLSLVGGDSSRREWEDREPPALMDSVETPRALSGGEVCCGSVWSTTLSLCV